MPSKKRASKARLPETRQPKLKQNRGNPNPPPPPVEYQFQPGKSGNPGGQHKGATILSKAYFDALAQPVKDDPQGRTYAELVANGQLIAAAKGSTPAAVEIRKATEGDKMVFDVSKLSDSELDARIAELERTTRALAGGETEASGSSESNAERD